MESGPMVHLTTVAGIFHGRVVAARLGADGILTELRGDVGAVYPLGGLVEVFVDGAQAEEAHQILLADQVEAALAGSASPEEADTTVARRARPWLRLAWLMVGVMVGLYLLAMFG